MKVYQNHLNTFVFVEISADEVKLWRAGDAAKVKEVETRVLVEGLKRKIPEYVIKGVGLPLQKGSIESLQEKYPAVTESSSC